MDYIEHSSALSGPQGECGDGNLLPHGEAENCVSSPGWHYTGCGFLVRVCLSLPIHFDGGLFSSAQCVASLGYLLLISFRGICSMYSQAVDFSPWEEVISSDFHVTILDHNSIFSICSVYYSVEETSFCSLWAFSNNLMRLSYNGL